MKKQKASSFFLASPKKKSKLDTMFEQLESSNAAFLSAAAAQSMAVQLAHVKAPAALPSALSPLKLDGHELARRAERRQRFLEEQAAAAAAAKLRPSSLTLVAARTQNGGVARGQNTNLEKDYLRLTSLPSVADVRPPAVLKQALRLVQQRWGEEGCEYKYACDQLKGIRQDLTVQHVRSSLTVAVYETHGRIALEAGDWAEFRQSHAVLKQLYGEGLGGHHAEFKSYGLMLAAATGREVLAHELQESVAGRSDPGDAMFKHALAAVVAYSSNNYVALLQLYESAQKMAAYGLDLLVERLRPRAYRAILAAYQPSVPLEAVGTWLGLEEGAATRAWVREQGGRVGREGALLVNESREGLARVHAGAGR